MTDLTKRQLNAKLKNLTEIYKGLKSLQRFKIKDLEKNIEHVWAVAFGIVAAIEEVLDIGQYILASKNIKIESYREIPEKLYSEKIISRKFADKLIQMSGFRNRAIHNYPSLDIKMLYNILQNDIDDFKKFLKIINAL